MVYQVTMMKDGAASLKGVLGYDRRENDEALMNFHVPGNWPRSDNEQLALEAESATTSIHRQAQGSLLR